MASIRKLQSGNYQVQIRLVGLPPVTKSFSKKKNALSFAKQVEGDTELQRKLGKATAAIPLFTEWCDIYIANYTGKDHSTVGRLKWWCERIGHQTILNIDEFIVDACLVELDKKGLTGSTINRYKSTLSSVFISFIRHPDYKRAGFTNPVRKESVSRFQENPSKDRFLDGEEQGRLLVVCRESHWGKLYLLVLMALTTGARKGELLHLRWVDINFHARTASLCRASTKNNKPRLLPLSEPVIQEMMKFRKNNTDLLFHSTVSNSTPFDITKAWLKAEASLQVEHFRFHDLRHTAASNLVRAGRSLFEVGTLLGHSSTSMTARYSHLAINDTQSMVDAVMGELR